MRKTHVSKNEKETAALARAFIRELATKKPARALVVALSGDLGAGKTAFVRAAARALGVRRAVSSPTFVIIKRHALPRGRKHSHLFHIDAYRLKSAKELMHLGWRDITADPRHIVFIEWPELVPGALPRGTSRVCIEYLEGNRRKFTVKI